MKAKFSDMIVRPHNPLDNSQIESFCRFFVDAHVRRAEDEFSTQCNRVWI